MLSKSELDIIDNHMKQFWVSVESNEVNSRKLGCSLLGTTNKIFGEICQWLSVPSRHIIIEGKIMQ